MRKSTALVSAVVVLFTLALIAVVANQQSVAQAPEASRGRMFRFEYKTIQANLAAEAQGKGDLNSLGQEGWELCAAVQNDQGAPFIILQRSVNPSPNRRRGFGQAAP